MEKPRKIYVISTEFFQILFSKESTYTAQILSENADRLYKLAQSNVEIKNNRTISVIISPDSEKFSVNYTPTPYNRIIIYEAVPEFNDAVYKNILLSSFYNELVHQVFQNAKGDLIQQISDILYTDKIQPVYLENLPFSMLEGIQFIEEQNEILTPQQLEEYNDSIPEDTENLTLSSGRFNDGFFLQILSQAKLENKFPSFIQASGVMDIYPGKILAQACGSAFCAYLQQQWGFEKFYSFCKKCGNFNLSGTEGIFYEVYEIPLPTVWENFKNSIPLPADLSTLNYLEKNSTEILPNENKGLYEHLIYSPYGIIWYDKIRHEVSLYKPENNYILEDFLSGLIGRKLLFLADDVTKLSLSPDGRFLSVSYNKNRLRENLNKNATAIFDLKTQFFIGEKYNLRDSSIVTLKDGSYGIAGICDKNNYAAIQVYRSEKMNKIIQKENSEYGNSDLENSSFSDTQNDELLFEKEFSPDSIPFSLVYADNGNLFSILSVKNFQYIYKLNFLENTDNFYRFNSNEPIKIRNLSINENPYFNNQNQNFEFLSKMLTFEFSSPVSCNFTKFGFIFLAKDCTPSQSWFSQNNFPGGSNFPIIKNDDLYYSAIKYDHGEIRKIKLNLIKFANSSISEYIEVNPYLDSNKIASYNESIFNIELDPYHQFPEIFKGAVTLFMPIKEISVEKEAELWPGLGITFKSYSDRFENNQIFISAGLGYLDLTYEKYFNPTKQILNQIEQARITNNADFSGAFLYKNSSTPTNLFAGTIFQETRSSGYNLKALVGSALTVPLGMKFRKLNLNFETDYTASTNFRNLSYSQFFPNKSTTTAFNQSYQNISLSYKIEYTNLHQFGFSPYELRGLTAALTAKIFWDIGLPQLITENDDLNYRFQQFSHNYLFKPSQINLGFSSSVKIPQLSLIKDYNNWILCFPTSIDLELFNNYGNAMHVKAETLIFGKEIQYGLNFLHLYFSRFGLKLAYDYNLVYDETKVSPPDLRDISKFYSSFVNTTIDDALSVTAMMDFIPAIGFLSSDLLHTDFIYQYFFRSKTSKFSISLKLIY